LSTRHCSDAGTILWVKVGNNMSNRDNIMDNRGSYMGKEVIGWVMEEIIWV